MPDGVINFLPTRGTDFGNVVASSPHLAAINFTGSNGYVCVRVASFVFVTPEGFTTMVANEGLEKARAYLNQVPWDRQLNVPSEGHKGNPSQLYFLDQG